MTPNNEPLKPLTAFMEDLVEYFNERSSDAYIWFLTIGIGTLGYGIVALIAIPFFGCCLEPPRLVLTKGHLPDEPAAGESQTEP